jgi:hypothetical protein
MNFPGIASDRESGFINTYSTQHEPCEAAMKKFMSIVTAFLLMFMTGRTLQAELGDVINIQLGASPFYNNGAAINDVSPQYWNAFAGTDQASWAPLLTSDYTLSTASIMYNMTGSTGLDATGTAFPDGNIDKPLMRGFVSTDAVNTGVINIKGLATGNYFLYAYSQVDKDLTSHLNFIANGVSGSLSNNGTLTQLVKNQNWMVTSVSVASDGLLNISINSDNQINGLQIASVPEPDSIVLLGVGGVLALVFMRMNLNSVRKI